MNYPNIKDADDKLRIICEKNLNKKYDDTIISKALEQLEYELKMIAAEGSAAGWLTVYNALKNVDAKEDDYCFKGSIGSTVVSYVLDFTNFDPLTVMPKLYPEFVFTLSKDQARSIEVIVTEELHRKLIGYFNEYSIREKISRKFLEDGTQYGVMIGNVQEIDYKGTMDNAPTDTFEFLFLKVNPSHLSKSIREGEPFEEFKPSTIEGNIKCYGLSHSTGVWNDDIKTLVKKGIISLDQAISHREDVYELLINHGIEEEKAFDITEYIRKGKVRFSGWPRDMLNTLKSASIPEWFIRACENYIYLFPRSHALMLFSKY